MKCPILLFSSFSSPTHSKRSSFIILFISLEKSSNFPLSCSLLVRLDNHFFDRPMLLFSGGCDLFHRSGTWNFPSFTCILLMKFSKTASSVSKSSLSSLFIFSIMTLNCLSTSFSSRPPGKKTWSMDGGGHGFTLEANETHLL